MPKDDMHDQNSGKKITENNRLIGDPDIRVSTQNFKISRINVFKKTEGKMKKES